MALTEFIELWHEYRALVLLAAAIISVVIYVKRPATTTAPVVTKATTVSEVEKPVVKTVPLSKKPAVAAPMAVDFTTVAKTKRVPKKFSGQTPKSAIQLPCVDSKLKIFYSTLTGTSKRYAETVQKRLSEVMTTEPEVLSLEEGIDDLDEYFVSPGKSLANTLYILIVPSYECESPLDYFLQLLQETYNDFRIDSKPLSSLGGFSVFGLGDSERWPEEDKFCYQAAQVDKMLGKLGLKRMYPMGLGCVHNDAEDNVQEWLAGVEETLKDPSPPQEDDIVDSDDDEEAEDEEVSSSDVVDVEDMGAIIKENKQKKSAAVGKDSADASLKQMVAKDSPTYKTLTKQGYTIVGSHSGVKICRWTKSALRGRGSCYKYSFYGIKSHLCMETTPSLGCSSKCTFCWRTGSNPVATSWRWQVNEPEEILKGALEGHYRMIKQLKGVPGVVAARFAEAFRVRHCALSLVGEPIFYPHINKFVKLLHDQRISSFLVCNAQHPAELERMDRVTQLYVSIDAANKHDLKRIDRPLYRDFWDRMQQCLDILRKKSSQRTVFRLTLVKDSNMDDIDGYVDMVERARPTFIEIKGVTYCGTSKSSPLTMQNVPFYEEVKNFVEQLNQKLIDRGMDYGIAAEHAHSCCILIAESKFKKNGVWHTAIDYDKFFDMIEQGVEFGPEDYTKPTPEWAWYGNGGFNPEDTRFKKVRNHPEKN